MYGVRVSLLYDKELAKNFIVGGHYSHTMPQAVKFRFGFYLNEELEGVAVFSIPANQYSITSVFNAETQHIGIELSRVFVRDGTPRNFESYCLAQCFNWLKANSSYDVIVSYADPNFHHVGYLYQALNGLYIGITSPELRYIVNGQLITRRGLGRRKNDTEKAHAERLLDSGAVKVKMKGKHKYIFFICNKSRKRELQKKLKTNPAEYPKLINGGCA